MTLWVRERNQVDLVDKFIYRIVNRNILRQYLISTMILIR
jgi:hypothetical protein